MVTAEDLRKLLWKHVLDCNQNKSEVMQEIKIYLFNEPHKKLKLDDETGVLVERVDDYYLQTREWITDRKEFCDVYLDDNNNLKFTTHMWKADPERFETLSEENATRDEINHFIWVLQSTLKDHVGDKNGL